jgi:hypothetical protein
MSWGGLHAEIFAKPQKNQEQAKAGNGSGNGHTNLVTEEQLILRAKRAKNGALFKRLQSGDWDGKPVSRVRGGEGAILLCGRRVSMHLMMQPAVVYRLLSNSLLIEQGLLSRCLTVYPSSAAGTRKYREVNLRTENVRIQYENRIRAILETSLPLAEGKSNELTPRPLVLSQECGGQERNAADRLCSY